MDVSRLLAASVSPVVLISACGLITLALYNRLGAILARLRTFHRQKMELLAAFDRCETDEAPALLDELDSQIVQVTAKARAVRRSLYCLLSAVTAFLLCSIFAAAAVVYDPFAAPALATYFVGLLLFLAGIGWAIRELSLSITPINEESVYLETLVAAHLAKPADGRRKKSVSAAGA